MANSPGSMCEGGEPRVDVCACVWVSDFGCGNGGVSERGCDFSDSIVGGVCVGGRGGCISLGSRFGCSSSCRSRLRDWFNLCSSLVVGSRASKPKAGGRGTSKPYPILWNDGCRGAFESGCRGTGFCARGWFSGGGVTGAKGLRIVSIVGIMASAQSSTWIGRQLVVQCSILVEGEPVVPSLLVFDHH